MDKEHLTTVGALWYSRVVLYAFELSVERTGSANGKKRYIVPDLYQTLVKKTNTPVMGPKIFLSLSRILDLWCQWNKGSGGRTPLSTLEMGWIY